MPAPSCVVLKCHDPLPSAVGFSDHILHTLACALTFVPSVCSLWTVETFKLVCFVN